MNVQAIVITVLIILLVYFVFSWVFASNTKLSNLKNAQNQNTIAASSLPNNQTSNYAYSVWFYINDWSYRYGEPKSILGRLDKDNQPSPSIVLGALENNLKVSLACYPSKATDSSVIHTCEVANVPIQRWVNLIVSVYGRTLDIYIDGKLVRTCVLPGVPKINNDAALDITSGGGFDGFTSNINYYGHPVNPQEAWNIYKKGYGGSVLGELFNKYRVKVSFLQDNSEQSSFEI